MKELELKYGCNPNQKPSRIYMEQGELPLTVLNGKPGYINFLDALNGWQLVSELKRATGLPAATSFKHVSPAGAAVGLPLNDTLRKVYFVGEQELSPLACAYARARGADRMSSFGDWIALSDVCDESTARLIKPEVSDGIIAPGYTDEALALLKMKKKGNYNIVTIDPAYRPAPIEHKQVFGITFEQGRNEFVIDENLLNDIVTTNHDLPADAKRDLIVALIVLKYTQSNSVCYAKDGQAIGIGAGQQSRIHCTRLAGQKADNWLLRQHPRVLALPFVEKIARADRDNTIDVFISDEPDEVLADGRWQRFFTERPEPLTKEEEEKIQAVRDQLKEQGLVAFVADDAVLPRESGISSRPMKQSVAFTSPESLRVTMQLPHRGAVTGMGIPKGITLIVGGGYHGKSTLLTALELGVYNHIAGDGREFVITDETALKLRSEDGRFIKDVDISMFINDLPNGNDTHHFSTEDASGSTSQAAGIVEGMEAGSRLFLLDEDTSATNFMVRDAFMQKVVSPDKEPITPFLSRARDLYEQAGISTILVAGSSGAFFHIADTVIQMDRYKPVDITKKAKALCKEFPISEEKPHPFALPHSHRIMEKDKNGATKRRDYRSGAVRKNEPERLKLKTMGTDGFAIGKQTVDLRYLEQLIDSEQTACLGMLLKYAVEHLVDGKRTIAEVVVQLQKELETSGMRFLAENGIVSGGYAMPRVQEMYSCFNRYRV